MALRVRRRFGETQGPSEPAPYRNFDPDALAGGGETQGPSEPAPLPGHATYGGSNIRPAGTRQLHDVGSAPLPGHARPIAPRGGPSNPMAMMRKVRPGGHLEDVAQEPPGRLMPGHQRPGGVRKEAIGRMLGRKRRATRRY